MITPTQAGNCILVSSSNIFVEEYFGESWSETLPALLEIWYHASGFQNTFAHIDLGLSSLGYSLFINKNG